MHRQLFAVLFVVLAGVRVVAGDGPLAVETADNLTLPDPARKKDLPYKVYYPRTGGPFPVILFSHGFGGNKDAFGSVGRHWAGHGYVVIHPTHDDGVGRGKARPAAASSADGTKPAGRLLAGLNDPPKIAGRVADLSLILDSLDKLPDAVPALKGRIDPTRIGVGGHSFGAYTAMLIGGVTADLGTEKAKSFADRRVRCILPISAQGAGQQGLTESSWAALRIPMMTITGTLDRGAGGQGLDWKKEPFVRSPPGDKYLVVIDGANHMSFGGGLGARGAGPTEVVKRCSLRFWDAYLKNADDARADLRSDRLAVDAPVNFTLERK
jgi:predicted dienelactone hydrolase